MKVGLITGRWRTALAGTPKRALESGEPVVQIDNGGTRGKAFLDRLEVALARPAGHSAGIKILPDPQP